MSAKPYDNATQQPVAWLKRSSKHGYPVLIPCTLDGDPLLASSVLTVSKKQRKNVQHLDQSARFGLILYACHRVHGAARQAGAITSAR